MESKLISTKLGLTVRETHQGEELRGVKLRIDQHGAPIRQEAMPSLLHAAPFGAPRGALKSQNTRFGGCNGSSFINLGPAPQAQRRMAVFFFFFFKKTIYIFFVAMISLNEHGIFCGLKSLLLIFRNTMPLPHV